jgi:hypothetical protein
LIRIGMVTETITNTTVYQARMRLLQIVVKTVVHDCG